jgi:hypothetical protein
MALQDEFKIGGGRRLLKILDTGCSMRDVGCGISDCGFD